MNEIIVTQLYTCELSESVSLQLEYNIPYRNLKEKLNSKELRALISDISIVSTPGYVFKISSHGFNGFNSSLFYGKKKYQEYYHMFEFNAVINLNDNFGSPSNCMEFLHRLKGEFESNFERSLPYESDFTYKLLEKSIEVNCYDFPNFAVTKFEDIFKAIINTKKCFEKAASSSDIHNVVFNLDFEMHEM